MTDTDHELSPTGWVRDQTQRILSTGVGAVNPDSLRSLVQRAVAGNWVQTCKMWDTTEGPTCGSGGPTRRRSRNAAGSTVIRSRN